MTGERVRAYLAVWTVVFVIGLSVAALIYGAQR